VHSREEADQVFQGGSGRVVVNPIVPHRTAAPRTAALSWKVEALPSPMSPDMMKKSQLIKIAHDSAA
jgi:hypothetical protein